MSNIAEIRNLSVEFPLPNGTIHAVNNLNFNLLENTITALVGESGSGKSTMASTLLNMVSSPGVITSGSVTYQGDDILKYDKHKTRKYRWKEVSMVFQAAQNALNPVMTIKDQITETVYAHESGETDETIVKRAGVLLDYVKLDPSRVLNCYPHELSGGMKQRVMIAFALLLKPKILILDEPTTALDVITQDYIFDILTDIQKEMKLTMLLMTHDIAVVAKVAQLVGVMYAGNLVEMGDAHTIFKESSHEYTRQLIEAAPSLIGEVKERRGIMGSPPNLIDIPKGCAFAPRCTIATDQCLSERPAITDLGNNHLVQCLKCQNKEVNSL